ncbi:MAG: BsaWI family type II restriction enzyme, partial [Bacteroidia bacterium]
YNGKSIMFGGIHCKASLAERVSDDVPCSLEMMKKGYASILFTFDAKSYPPPNDMVNRGELGTIENPSDKRRYIEDHGSFDACFSYNLRTVPSRKKTKSGRKIYVSNFSIEDPLPQFILSAWEKFKAKNRG